MEQVLTINQQISQFLLENQWILWLIILWVLPWKVVALWKAAKSSHKLWFVALLILNTLAILEILYIFVFSKKKQPKEKILS